jgi:hypothetical protein
MPPVFAIGEGHEGDLIPRQELLDDGAVAAGAKTALFKEVGDRRLGLLLAGGDHHPFAGGQPVGLEHDRIAEAAAGGAGLGGVVHHRERRGGNAVPLHELLGEHLAALDLRRPLAGSEDRQPAAPELVGDAQGERQLRPHDRQIDPQVGGEVGEAVDLLGRHRHQVGQPRDAGIARRAVQISEQLALPQLPAQGVLARARSHH